MKGAISFFVLAAFLLMAGCVNTDYVGESYTPTSTVDVYYSTEDVKRPHAVMGKITATAMDGWDSQAMVDELKKQAMAKGADALVIEGVHTETTGSHTTTIPPASEPRWVVGKDGKLREVPGSASPTSSITTETKEKVMDAELLKYTAGS
ncbi:MAG: hypothetical protein AAGF57_19080 [Pseudomonadota bacterium]